MSATEKQVGYIIYLARQLGYSASSYIDSRLGRAMGLGMRARSGAGRLESYARGLSVHQASEVIGALRGAVPA